MRHAEKMADLRNPNLSDAGLARAQKLADFIPATFGPPQFLFATSMSKHSARPLQTITPLSDKIGIKINTSYADQDYGGLAYELLGGAQYAGALTLVCWHHGNIPPLAHALRAKSGDYPDPSKPYQSCDVSASVLGGIT